MTYGGQVYHYIAVALSKMLLYNAFFGEIRQVMAWSYNPAILSSKILGHTILSLTVNHLLRLPVLFPEICAD